MLCYECGNAELIHETRDLEYSYRGQRTIIKGVEGDFCPACGESFLDDEQAEHYSDRCLDFNRLVNARDFDIELFLRVRDKFGLTRKDAGEIFGGGVNAFSRYETGRTLPPKSLIQLFTILDKQPAAIEHIVPEMNSRLIKIEEKIELILDIKNSSYNFMNFGVGVKAIAYALAGKKSPVKHLATVHSFEEHYQRRMG
jgi:HTH-type transcriptional regulator / antitoxin MqsA